MPKINLQEEIRRITNEIAANAAAKALEVSSSATAKAAEVATAATAEAARVSTLAIAKALDAATLAATKAADAASAAAAIATSTSGDLQRIKEDIIKINQNFDKINDKLDDKYLTKQEFVDLKAQCNDHETRLRLTETSITRTQTYGTIFLISMGVIEFLMNKFIK